jgi:hypothetical protein
MLQRVTSRISLRGKLLLASILVEIVMLGLLVGNSVRLIDQHLGQQLEVRIQAIEQAYKTAVALPLASRDYATLRDILDGWRRAEDVRYLVVTDRQGRTLAASGWNSDQPLPPPGPDAQGGDVRNVRFSVDYLGQVYGDVQYGLSTSFIRVAKRELLTQGGMIALAESKPPAHPPIQSRTNQVLAGSRSGNSSSIRLFRQVGSFSKVSRNHAAGSRPLRRAVPSRL